MCYDREQRTGTKNKLQCASLCAVVAQHKTPTCLHNVKLLSVYVIKDILSIYTHAHRAALVSTSTG